MSKYVTLHGFGSDGVELNFEVIGDEIQPINVSDNIIWVNTNIPITSYIFSNTEPIGSKGMVWISTVSHSEVEFNALKDNFIQICPCYVKQYIDGVWVDKDAKISRDGEWKKFFEPVYIMKDGVMTSSSYTWSGGTGTFKTTTYNGVSVYQTGVYNSTNTTTSTLSNIKVPVGAKTFCVSYYLLAAYGTNPTFHIGSCSASVNRNGNLKITIPGTVKIDVTSIAGADTTVQFKYVTAGSADNGTNYFGSMWFE